MTRYQLALLAHSQRWLPPSLAFLVVLGILYSDPGGGLLPLYAISAGALLVVACWLTIALVDAEDPVQRLITRVHARRTSVLIGGVAAAVLCCCLGLTALSLVISVLRHHDVIAEPVWLGTMAHLACAFAGIAVGLPCSRLVLPRVGHTVIVALAALSVVLRFPWIPLVNPMLRVMTADSARLAPVLSGLIVCAGVLVLSSGAVTALYRHRA
ncbi:hypothetical protein HFP15_10660 [Amycolatopsis sp. K13G38]|uniref:ABC transporter n=1 Tax=Amycolatopsis acididurans TaxID=2724524 RepID=A0ABX1J0N7_9PSEU|nr:hypothetical protein [Amycolatopsis acididurans]NKQ53343.1 hypothetical protein [Amycolatopsis acididurans]